ncbi:MAG TPA: hypothetical protein PJ982_04630, partial [Lacipirellulaceae bacterium]|nr:hypothetical protein [Lacipirellulaceae bacterium]
NPRCPNCSRLFNRAPGYFLGSIYVNYGLTAVLLVAGYFTVFFVVGHVSQSWLAALAAMSLLFPLWFFRYARNLWIACDEWLDPWPNEQEQALTAKSSVTNDQVLRDADQLDAGDC